MPQVEALNLHNTRRRKSRAQTVGSQTFRLLQPVSGEAIGHSVAMDGMP
jgi:hypothetical protein